MERILKCLVWKASVSATVARLRLSDRSLQRHDRFQQLHQRLGIKSVSLSNALGKTRHMNTDRNARPSTPNQLSSSVMALPASSVHCFGSSFPSRVLQQWERTSRTNPVLTTFPCRYYVTPQSNGFPKPQRSFSQELIDPNASVELPEDPEEREEMVLTKLAQRLNGDKFLTDKLVQKLSHDMKLRVANEILSSRLDGKEYSSFIAGRHRRAITVREVSMSLKTGNLPPVDTNGDGVVSSAELDEWLRNLENIQHQYDLKQANHSGDSQLDQEVRSEESKVQSEHLTNLQIKRLILISGIPLIGFGLLDNGVMITAGDFIEKQFGSRVGISPLAAAGLGNMFSNVLGWTFGSWVEKGARRMGFKDPKLTLRQLSMPQTKNIQLYASIICITIGGLLGMFPLLFR